MTSRVRITSPHMSQGTVISSFFTYESGIARRMTAFVVTMTRTTRDLDGRRLEVVCNTEQARCSQGGTSRGAIKFDSHAGETELPGRGRLGCL